MARSWMAASEGKPEQCHLGQGFRSRRSGGSLRFCSIHPAQSLAGRNLARACSSYPRRRSRSAAQALWCERTPKCVLKRRPPTTSALASTRHNAILRPVHLSASVPAPPFDLDQPWVEETRETATYRRMTACPSDNLCTTSRHTSARDCGSSTSLTHISRSLFRLQSRGTRWPRRPSVNLELELIPD